MSGHSKWAQIKRQKAVTDQRRSGLFTKLAKGISVAAKQGGPDPEMNFRLRMAIDTARSANMPNDNIERAIQRAAGVGEGAIIEEVVYEAYGPHGVAVIIEAATDNKNRTASDIKRILSHNNANLGSTNSVRWMFTSKGIIRVDREDVSDPEAFELAAIEGGAEDIRTDPEGFTITSTPESLPSLKKHLEKNQFRLTSTEIESVPQSTVPLDEAGRNGIQKLIEELEESEDVTNIFTNAEI
ncbi:MAG: YebC/PmpR family DNA-binding transcriptional regulator [Candidatus Kerfeldbacteria bacterium]|nr:YebC/PmpR family DNA-binding transcriptional regulator [Candidatus Kerfeldbacteria bacterium]